MPVFTFGRYRLDSAARRLARDQEPVPLPERHFDILLHLVSHAGEVLTKDALIDAAWRGIAVTDNSLEQAVSALRRALSDPAEAGESYIQTVPRRGYRFAGEVAKSVHRESDAHLDALLAPHRAWIEGQTALETLEREQVGAAREAFVRALELTPDVAQIHVGLANACAFGFESTRSDAAPDTRALATAVHHAREACRLAPGLAEAWATLGFVLNRAGVADDALAAARRAVSLEPDNWRHQLRLAFVGWGEERLRATTRALDLLPGLGLAHFLAATVHVARQAFDRADRELEAGAVAQDEQGMRRSRFTAVGLHWLRGLVRLQAGDREGARASLDRELAFEPAGHLYTRECCANVHYALGALAARAGDRAGAIAACGRALTYATGHAMPLALHAALTHRDGPARTTHDLDERLVTLRTHGHGIDAAAAAVVPAVLRGDTASAAALLDDAVAHAPPGPQGWLLPVDPVLRMSEDPQVWGGVLALLRARAA